MSTSPDIQRADDQIITLLSHWLTRTLGNDELRKRIEEIGTEELAPGQRNAVAELLRELAVAAPGEGGAEGVRLVIDAPSTASRAAVGDSIAINGCCLTVIAVEDGRFVFDAVPETLARSSLEGLRAGSRVNLEPALRAGEPLGGHYVQ